MHTKFRIGDEEVLGEYNKDLSSEVNKAIIYLNEHRGLLERTKFDYMTIYTADYDKVLIVEIDKKSSSEMTCQNVVCPKDAQLELLIKSIMLNYGYSKETISKKYEELKNYIELDKAI